MVCFGILVFSRFNYISHSLLNIFLQISDSDFLSVFVGDLVAGISCYQYHARVFIIIRFILRVADHCQCMDTDFLDVICSPLSMHLE